MFDNPLYGAMGKSRAKDQDHPPKDLLVPPDPNFPSFKPADSDPDRPPVPTPRHRSFTCSETKPPPPTCIPSRASAHKKPVVPSRSEGGFAPERPPLPSKSRPGVPEPQNPRDYRESAELLGKLRPPGRPGQPPPPKDRRERSLSFFISPANIICIMELFVFPQCTLTFQRPGVP